MNILFLGGTHLGWKCCRQILLDGHTITGILSIPEIFQISWAESPVPNVNYHTFDDLSGEYEIQHLTVGSGMKGDLIYEFCREAEPDLIVVIGWYYMIPKRIRDLAALGTVGVHASLLPKYRGGAPLVWAMIKGERETGVSLLHLTRGIDEGAIVEQSAFEIAESDTISDVLSKAESTSLEIVGKAMMDFRNGTAKTRAQDNDQATYGAQRQPEDGLIDWSTLGADDVYNWVRAQSRPYPGAFAYLGGERLRIWSVSNSSTSRPDACPGDFVGGKVCCADGKFVQLERILIADRGPEMNGLELHLKLPGHRQMGWNKRKEAETC